MTVAEMRVWLLAFVAAFMVGLLSLSVGMVRLADKTNDLQRQVNQMRQVQPSPTPTVRYGERSEA